jgi:hypothetical protein
VRRTEAIYGTLPDDLGTVDATPTEMLYWLYCPIKLPGSITLTVPPNLKQFRPIIDAVGHDCGERLFNSYVYITAKTLYCSSENPGNRPGWHSDGFLTDDLNYIWYDANPTIFFHDGERHAFTADHSASLSEMDALCEPLSFARRIYPAKRLLRLDETVLHKVDLDIRPGIRTFVKISVSRHRYALQGNSINYALAPDWEYQPRQAERNCPVTP